MAQPAAHLLDHVIPHVPLRQWVRVCQVRLPIPLRLLPAAQPKLVAPMLQVACRAITRFLLDQTEIKADEAPSGAGTLIQRFGSAANLNIHLHCLVLDGVYQCDPEGEPVCVEVPAPTDEALLTVLHKIITRMTQAAHPQGGARRRTGPDHHGRRRQRLGRGPRTQAAAGSRLNLQAAPAEGPELCEGAACKVVAAGVHAAAGGPGAQTEAAPDPFGVRVTSLREVSGPPLREPRRCRTQRQAARAGGAAGGAAGTRTTRAGCTAGRVRGALCAPPSGSAELGQAAQAGLNCDIT